ncbi:terminase small subunit [Sulfuricystis thermophila]|uniref:terminase small subunit n=1 Tax=Sulfuricystis thermophila TaxID=2496847 RepID=UPI0010356B21|nr:terminase small subunit [Sulfuricystis thermophila]
MNIVGQQQIADLFAVSRETIDSWQKEGMPVAVRGGPGTSSEYNSRACIDWLVDRELRKAQAVRPQDRLARAQADKIEMENAERRGMLIPADQLEPKLKAAFVAAREAWLEAPQRLARELPEDLRLREEMLQAEFEAFLNRLADWACAGPGYDEDEAEANRGK